MSETTGTKSPSKVRINQVAKETGYSIQALIAAAQAIGLDVKSHSSTVLAGQVPDIITQLECFLDEVIEEEDETCRSSEARSDMSTEDRTEEGRWSEAPKRPSDGGELRCSSPPERSSNDLLETPHPAFIVAEAEAEAEAEVIENPMIETDEWEFLEPETLTIELETIVADSLPEPTLVKLGNHRVKNPKQVNSALALFCQIFTDGSAEADIAAELAEMNVDDNRSNRLIAKNRIRNRVLTTGRFTTASPVYYKDGPNDELILQFQTGARVGFFTPTGRLSVGGKAAVKVIQNHQVEGEPFDPVAVCACFHDSIRMTPEIVMSLVDKLGSD